MITAFGVYVLFSRAEGFTYSEWMPDYVLLIFAYLPFKLGRFIAEFTNLSNFFFFLLGIVLSSSLYSSLAFYFIQLFRKEKN